MAPQVPAQTQARAEVPVEAPTLTKPDPGEPAPIVEMRPREAPDVIPGQVVVEGPLDKEIIRRVLRRHVAEFKDCYLPALAKKPDLSGRVSVTFKISPKGEVRNPVLQSSQLKEAGVEKCIVQVFRSLQFPKPLGHGSVTATYPIHFQNGVPNPLVPTELDE